MRLIVRYYLHVQSGAIIALLRKFISNRHRQDVNRLGDIICDRK